MKKYITILLISLITVITAKASCCTALSCTNWETPSTWSCGQVPACGDSVYIPAGITVTITSVLSYSTTCVSPAMTVTVAGTLFFQTGKKLELPCGSVMYVLTGGIVDPGNGGGSSNIVSICGTNYWIAGSGKAYGPLCWGCSVLPIKVATFNATCNTNEVMLSWSTSTEVNNHYFSIERSDDGLSWTKMAKINGAGTTSVTQYYKWVDAEPLPGTAYYRLMQTDFDGHSAYAATTTCSCNNEGLVTVYPNPSRGNVFCKILSSCDQVVLFNIMDNVGQYVASYKASLAKGLSAEQLHTGKLAPGIYILSIMFNDSSVPIRRTFVVSQ